MAAPVALAFRIAANLSELRANLAEAKAQVETTKRAMQQMANSLDGSKVIADANAMVKVVSDLEGASKLTAAEQKRVNATVTEAIAKYQALGRSAPAEMLALAEATKKVDPPTSTLSKTLGDLGTHIAATAAGFVSAQAVIGGVQMGVRLLADFVEGSIQSYANAEAAAKKMTVALQQQGTATPGVIGHFNDLATQFQRTTAYSDDLINEMEALLTQVGNVAPAQMDKALRASTDLASGLGIDLQSATMLVAKAFAGGGDELGRLKAILGEAYRPGMDMAEVLGAIESKFGGQAQAEAETYAGRIKQIANEWDNLKEAVGKAIVTDPRIVELLDYLQGRITGVGESAEKHEATLTEWWARLASDKYAAAAIGYLNDVDRAIQQIGADMPKVQPPREFTEFGGALSQHLKDLKRESDAVVASTVEGWKKQQEAAQRYADAVESAFKKFSGAGAAEQMKVLDTVFRRLADSGVITRQQLDGIVQEAVKLSGEGARLSPRLWDVVWATGALEPKLATSALNMEELGTKVQLTLPWFVQLNDIIGGLQDKLKLGLSGEVGIKVPVDTKQLGKSIFNGADWDAVTENSKTHLRQMAKDAQATYEYMRDHSASFSQATIRHFKKIAEDATHAAEGTKSAWDRVYGALGNVSSIFDAIGGKFATTVSLISRTGQAVMSNLAEGNLFGAITSGVTGAIGVIKNLVGASSAGRDAVKSWVEENYGNFAGLQAKLRELVAAGTLTAATADQMWRSVTQGVGRNNPEEAKKKIAEFTKQLEAAQQAADGLLASQNQHIGELLGQLQGLGAGSLLQPYLDKLATAKGLTSDNLSLLQQLASDGTVSFEQMQKAAQALGVSTDSLGQSFQAAKAKGDWQSIVDNLDTLVRGGADLNGLLGEAGLQKKINDLVVASMKFGTEIPANAKPWIEQLAQQGKLLDANGQKISDTSKLKFGGDLQTSMQTLIDKVGELIDKLSNGIPGALNKIPDHKNIDMVVNTREIREWGGSKPAWGGEQAAGGDYLVTQPTLFLAGEAGPERATFSGAGNVSAGRKNQMLQPITIELAGRPLWQGLMQTAYEEGLA